LLGQVVKSDPVYSQQAAQQSAIRPDVWPCISDLHVCTQRTAALNHSFRGKEAELHRVRVPSAE